MVKTLKIIVSFHYSKTQRLDSLQFHKEKNIRLKN